MKATGIVRRIDDLGRVVIPKEIRRTLHIRESDPLEIFTGPDGTVIFKKYSPMGELSGFADQLCQAMSKTSGRTVAICDTDAVLCAAGSKSKLLLEKPITQELGQLLRARGLFEAGREKPPIAVSAGEELPMAGLVAPILSEGDMLGGVIFCQQEGESPLTEADKLVVQTAALFLGKHMES